jgi:thioredoxin-related protein
VSDNDTGLTKLNSRKYVIVAVAATFSVWYAHHAQTVHAIDVVDNFIYNLVQMVLGSLGGLIVFFLGSLLLLGLPAAGLVYSFQWKYYYSAALFAFWLGINLVNVSILNVSTGNLSELLCDAGYGCFALATLAGVIFSREQVPAPDPNAAQPTWGASHSHSAWALPQSGRLIFAIAALFGLYSVYVHGSDWLGALITPGASKDAWPDNFKAAMAQAGAEHKSVLLHFTGSDWCPACQELDRNIINTATFRNYVAQNLVYVEVDMPRNKFQPPALKKQNTDLVNEFEIQGFPTVIVLNRVGKNIGEIVGYPGGEGPSAYIADLEKLIKADGAK